jgi:hypothetical protein
MSGKNPEVELDRIRQAAVDAMTFVEGLDKIAFVGPPMRRYPLQQIRVFRFSHKTSSR